MDRLCINALLNRICFDEKCFLIRKYFKKKLLFFFAAFLKMLLKYFMMFGSYEKSNSNNFLKTKELYINFT